MASGCLAETTWSITQDQSIAGAARTGYQGVGLGLAHHLNDIVRVLQSRESDRVWCSAEHTTRASLPLSPSSSPHTPHVSGQPSISPLTPTHVSGQSHLPTLSLSSHPHPFLDTHLLGRLFAEDPRRLERDGALVLENVRLFLWCRVDQAVVKEQVETRLRFPHVGLGQQTWVRGVGVTATLCVCVCPRKA